MFVEELRKTKIGNLSMNFCKFVVLLEGNEGDGRGGFSQ